MCLGLGWSEEVGREGQISACSGGGASQSAGAGGLGVGEGRRARGSLSVCFVASGDGDVGH